MELIYFKLYKSYKPDYVDQEKLLIKLHDYSDWSLKNKMFSKMLFLEMNVLCVPLLIHTSQEFLTHNLLQNVCVCVLPLLMRLNIISELWDQIWNSHQNIAYVVLMFPLNSSCHNNHIFC